MNRKQKKNAAKILFSWRKLMPFYYGAAWIILLLIAFINN
tara:strand:- start:204 stop:323 length:120 start_codon:yes stop_codon:yes gene_type:complete